MKRNGREISDGGGGEWERCWKGRLGKGVNDFLHTWVILSTIHVLRVFWARPAEKSLIMMHRCLCHRERKLGGGGESERERE